MDGAEVRYLEVARSARLGEVLERYGGEGVFSTGYFRDRIDCAGRVTEITAAIRGVGLLVGEVDVIIDVGGQDAKVTIVPENRFHINDRCSAGTGAFLDAMAAYLGVPLAELGGMHERSQRGVRINNTCTVFAQSEIVSHLAAGERVEDVVRGLHVALATRVAQLVPDGYERIALIGGVSLNAGFVGALENALGLRVTLPGRPQFVNAVGAAVYGNAMKGEG